MFIAINLHCVKSVQIQSFCWSVFSRSKEYLSVFSPNAGKYGPEKTPYLDTLHAALSTMFLIISKLSFWGQKSSLVSGNQAGENIFITYQPAQSNMYQNIYFQFQKTNKNAKKKKPKKNKNTKKQKKTKEEKRISISMENRFKKLICGRPGENFSRHPHFWKRVFFFGLKMYSYQEIIFQFSYNTCQNLFSICLQHLCRFAKNPLRIRFTWPI